jgi:tetratricopeptide (TPR) repeat protein
MVVDPHVTIEPEPLTGLCPQGLVKACLAPLIPILIVTLTPPLPLQGLVEAYLEAQPPKVREALAMAKEALQLMKNDPKALTLIGLVLMHTEGKEKARKAFENALRYDAHSTDAILALVQLEVSEGHVAEDPPPLPMERQPVILRPLLRAGHQALAATPGDPKHGVGPDRAGQLARHRGGREEVRGGPHALPRRAVAEQEL